MMDSDSESLSSRQSQSSRARYTDPRTRNRDYDSNNHKSRSSCLVHGARMAALVGGSLVRGTWAGNSAEEMRYRDLSDSNLAGGLGGGRDKRDSNRWATGRGDDAGSAAMQIEHGQIHSSATIVAGLKADVHFRETFLFVWRVRAGAPENNERGHVLTVLTVHSCARVYR